MDFARIRSAIIDFDPDLTKSLIEQALKENQDPSTILEKGLIAGMKEVGKLFAKKEYFVPEVLIASEAFYAGFDIVRSLIKRQPGKQDRKVVIGVVEGDIHDIGKNIVKVMIQASGCQVIDLGKDVPVEEFVEAVIKERPQILGLSALMSTTMMRMKDIIDRLEEQGIRNDLKVIVGGAPLTDDFAKDIGADGYAEDATEAVRLIDEFAKR